MFGNLFGWLSRNRASQTQVVESPVTPAYDGSVTIESGNTAGYYGFALNVDNIVTDDLEMIGRYRDIANYPDCDNAIEQIVNEAIITNQHDNPVEINLDKLPQQYRPIATQITKEFKKILSMYDFNQNCHDMFKRWYVDGRIFYYMTVDNSEGKKGIKSITYIDPKKIKRVVEIEKKMNDSGIEVIKGTKEYYMFNDKGLTANSNGIELSPDTVIDVPSGLIEASSGKVISYLYQAIKPVNQLKMMEDAQVIYRITRAPERRLFYVDVGNMPPQKAEQYVQGIMNKFRNKVQYDAVTGEIKNGRNYISAIEDFWIPRREGGKSTEISTLPAGQALDQIADIVYFQNKLYQALHVPRQRLNPENNFQYGRTTEISREEILFNKFVQRLRNKFNLIFLIPLRTQLISKKIIKERDWEAIKNYIMFIYQQDNHFEEMKKVELLNERISQLSSIDGFRGTYFSQQWIMKNVLGLTNEEIIEMAKEIKAESTIADNTGAGEEDDGGGMNVPIDDNSIADTSSVDYSNMPMDNTGDSGEMEPVDADALLAQRQAEQPVNTQEPSQGEPSPEQGNQEA